MSRWFPSGSFTDLHGAVRKVQHHTPSLHLRWSNQCRTVGHAVIITSPPHDGQSQVGQRSFHPELHWIYHRFSAQHRLACTKPEDLLMLHCLLVQVLVIQHLLESVMPLLTRHCGSAPRVQDDIIRVDDIGGMNIFIHLVRLGCQRSMFTAVIQHFL